MRKQKKKMNIDIDKRWQQYRNHVFKGIAVPKEQETEMRHAFLAGQLDCLTLFNQVAEEIEDEEEAAEVLELFSQRLIQTIADDIQRASEEQKRRE